MIRAPYKGLVAAGLIAGVLATSAGCSFGTKQAWADVVTGAANKARQAGSADATLSVAVALVTSKTPRPPGPPRISPAQIGGLSAQLDFGTDRSLVGAAQDPTTAKLVFDGSRVYERRAIRGAAAAPAIPGAATNLTVLGQPVPAGAGLKPTRRPWLTLDFSRLPAHDPNRVAGSFGINPDFVVRLVGGALTGSVQRIGTEQINDVITTHYAMNVGRDKAERGLPDKAKSTLDRVFRANAISGLVYHADVWVGVDGLPRRILMRFRQSLSRDDRADLFVGLDVKSYGAPITIPVPAKDQTATVANFGQLVHTAVTV